MSVPRQPSTRTARAGLGRPAPGGGVGLTPSITLASVKAFADLEALDSAMEGREAYARYGSDVVELLEDALADLEQPDGGPRPLARVTASGQAALLLAMTLLVSPRRRRVVVVRPCYSATETLLAGPLGALGVRLTTVDLTADEADHGALVERVLGDDVAAVITEVVVNPLMRVVDIDSVIGAAHSAGAACLVDSTFTPPILLRPFSRGADAVLHSLTKHLSGHSDVLGGALLVSPQHEAADWLDGFSRVVGVRLGSFDAWLTLRGLRTAALRVERGSATAAALAGWFAAQPHVAAVHYPGVHGERERALVAELLPQGAGAMLAIELDGGRNAVATFLEKLDGIRVAPSLGDASTTVSYPALTSHRSLSPEARRALGIRDGLVRISCGIEAIGDLQDEFAAALAAV